MGWDGSITGFTTHKPASTAAPAAPASSTSISRNTAWTCLGALEKVGGKGGGGDGEWTGLPYYTGHVAIKTSERDMTELEGKGKGKAEMAVFLLPLVDPSIHSAERRASELRL